MLEPLVSSHEYAQYMSRQARPESLKPCRVTNVEIDGNVMNNAIVYVCEVFCRFPDKNEAGGLCRRKKNYRNITKLKLHLKSAHDAIITVIGTDRRPQGGGRYPRFAYELSLAWLRTEVIPGMANEPIEDPISPPKKRKRKRRFSDFESSTTPKPNAFESLDDEQRLLVQQNRYLIQFDANTYLTRPLETRWVIYILDGSVDVAESRKLFSQNSDNPPLDGPCEACIQKDVNLTDCISNYPHCALTEYFGFPFAAEAVHNSDDDAWGMAMEGYGQMLDLGLPDDFDQREDDD